MKIVRNEKIGAATILGKQYKQGCPQRQITECLRLTPKGFALLKCSERQAVIGFASDRLSALVRRHEIFRFNRKP